MEKCADLRWVEKPAVSESLTENAAGGRMKKDDVITVKIEDLSSEGLGIGKYDGFTFFIKDTVIGDVAEAKVMKMKKTYGYARLTRLVEPSPDRVTPPCPVARQCGGCQIQAMSYEAQLRFKEKKVRGNLRRIGKFEDIPMEPIIGMGERKSADGTETGEISRGLPDLAAGMDSLSVAETGGRKPDCENSNAAAESGYPFRYRNKAQFPIGRDRSGKLTAGFYAGRTHTIIPCEDCLLGSELNRPILETVLAHMEKYQIPPYDETAASGLVRHVMTRVGFHTGQVMVCLVINGDSIPHAKELTENLSRVPGMTSIILNINKERTNVILGREQKLLWGKETIEDTIGDIRFSISAQSFYQVNPIQTEKLYRKALEYAALTGTETVWDLYCGIGTISLFLARSARQVCGVEIVPEAIRDARRNAELNQITNAEFYVGKAEEVLPEKYKNEGIHADVIVVDPPRKGCEESVLATMLQMAPGRIVYVSCDSATLARDLRYLCDGGYRLEKVCPVDQFGNSVHVETVVLLVAEYVNAREHVYLEYKPEHSIV